MSPGKHDAVPLSTYIQTHENIMQRMQHGAFVHRDDLTIAPGDGCLLIEGTIECAGNIVIEVQKTVMLLDDTDDPQAQTREYRYNVSVRNIGNLFRYDSPHPEHRREHHVHRYDLFGRSRRDEVEFLFDSEQRPTLGEVITEAEEWYWENYDRLREHGLVPT